MLMTLPCEQKSILGNLGFFYVFILPIFYLYVNLRNFSSGLTLSLVTFSLIPVTCVTRPRLAQTPGLVSDFFYLCICKSSSWPLFFLQLFEYKHRQDSEPRPVYSLMSLI